MRISRVISIGLLTLVFSTGVLWADELSPIRELLEAFKTLPTIPEKLEERRKIAAQLVPALKTVVNAPSTLLGDLGFNQAQLKANQTSASKDSKVTQKAIADFQQSLNALRALAFEDLKTLPSADAQLLIEQLARIGWPNAVLFLGYLIEPQCKLDEKKVKQCFYEDRIAPELADLVINKIAEVASRDYSQIKSESMDADHEDIFYLDAGQKNALIVLQAFAPIVDTWQQSESRTNDWRFSILQGLAFARESRLNEWLDFVVKHPEFRQMATDYLLKQNPQNIRLVTQGLLLLMSKNPLAFDFAASLLLQLRPTNLTMNDELLKQFPAHLEDADAAKRQTALQLYFLLSKPVQKSELKNLWNSYPMPSSQDANQTARQFSSLLTISQKGIEATKAEGRAEWVAAFVAEFNKKKSALDKALKCDGATALSLGDSLAAIAPLAVVELPKAKGQYTATLATVDELKKNLISLAKTVAKEASKREQAKAWLLAIAPKDDKEVVAALAAINKMK